MIFLADLWWKQEARGTAAAGQQEGKKVVDEEEGELE